MNGGHWASPYRGRVRCTVEEIALDNGSGREIDSVQVTCGRCGQVENAFGTGEASVRRCLAQLRADCPNAESNYYVAEDDDREG